MYQQIRNFCNKRMNETKKNDRRMYSAFQAIDNKNKSAEYYHNANPEQSELGDMVTFLRSRLDPDENEPTDAMYIAATETLQAIGA